MDTVLEPLLLTLERYLASRYLSLVESNQEFVISLDSSKGILV